MRLIKITICFLSVLIILCITIPLGNANTIPLYPDYSLLDIIVLLPFILVITIIVEFLTFLSFKYIFRDSGIPNRVDLFKSVVVVNLLSFPLTQLIAILVAVLIASYYIIFYFLIELFPIFVEFALFLFIFKKLIRSEEIRNDIFIYIDIEKIFLYTLTANLITFLIGPFLFLSTNFFSWLLS